MTYFSTITSKGQVTLPVALRRSLQIKPGQQVNFSLNDKHEIVITAAPTLEDIHQNLAAHFEKIGLTDAKLRSLAANYKNGDGQAAQVTEKYGRKS